MTRPLFLSDRFSFGLGMPVVSSKELTPIRLHRVNTNDRNGFRYLTRVKRFAGIKLTILEEQLHKLLRNARKVK